MCNNDLTWAVFVKDSEGLFRAVSYGSTEYECRLWLLDHEKRFEGLEVHVGRVFDLFYARE